ncbi:MAG: transketolase family protein [Oscillospiraceae bacterium]|nr:transketolase family protein [Oscillospiraceae bacterium]MBQ2145335.1 transketolase family protein [Oscillospiraceae bacterium]MBQ5489824.1 transketolase family protein [Oscillospiraceae bacterium]
MGELIATRDAFGTALNEFAKDNKDVVVLDADLAKATMSCRFKDAYPERFFDMGISEGDLVGTAAGLATTGKIPFACTFAMFAAGRAFEQIRNTVAYPRLNVKICGSHGGVAVGKDGASHQCIEDLAIMAAIPGMVVINPGDAVEMRGAVRAAMDYNGPVYIRLGRNPVPVVFDENSYTFEIGKGIKVREGSDITFVANGSLLDVAMKGADILAKEGISAEIIDIATIKPLDKDLIIESAKKTGKVLTLEEGVIQGGLGSAVAQALSVSCPVPMRYIGMDNCFGQSGDAADLMKYYGMSPENVVAKAKELI